MRSFDSAIESWRTFSLAATMSLFRPLKIAKGINPGEEYKYWLARIFRLF